jgi:hypothetical protein
MQFSGNETGLVVKIVLKIIESSFKCLNPIGDHMLLCLRVQQFAQRLHSFRVIFAMSSDRFLEQP